MNIRQSKGQVMRIHDERVWITNHTINATCDWYADNKQACIDEAVSGEVYVNDIEKYKAYCMEEYNKYKSGEFDVWLGFWQQAYYIQTGETVPILSD